MKHRPHRPTRARDDYGAQWGFVEDPADVPAAQQATHDMLIEHLGARRRGGVQWLIWTPAEATLQTTAAGLPIPPDIAELMRTYPGGRVVLALAEARR